jgi:phenylalanyl-tRNA synthetase beta chain
MKISYNWLKWYIPEAPDAEKLADIFTYHVAEVESVEKLPDGDFVYDIKILPNRAHDLLSHQGIAREIASLLNIKYVDPTPKYKVPESQPTKLIKRIETPKCRRYMGRIVRNIKIGPSPEWVVKHLESIGQRSINNIVDATNIVTFDCGQPAHVFDLSKVKDLKLQVRNAKNGEKMTLLGGAEKILNDTMMIIADDYGNGLDIAGVKGGEYAELNENTKDIILECANFDAVSIRKTAQALNIVTDAKKRFENDLSPELASYGMLELSALIFEMCPEAIFEDIVDVYPKKQEKRKLVFRADRISKILGISVSAGEIEDILKRYHIKFSAKGGPASGWEIIVPPMRLDLTIEEDMAEEIGRIMGYDKVKIKIPKIKFTPKQNDIYTKISLVREKLLADGYSEVMTYSFCDKGEVSVLASASDKKFLRTNLSDGLAASLKLNQINAPLLGTEETKVFEIGTIFKKGGEEINVAYGDKKEIKEMSLNEFCKSASPDTFAQVLGLGPDYSPKHTGSAFQMWSLFPFVARDVAVWVPEGVENKEVQKVIKENAGDMVVRGPELFDEFKKEGKISYAFRLVFQSYDRTLTDAEVNEIMDKINLKIEENGWQVR